MIAFVWKGTYEIVPHHTLNSVKRQLLDHPAETSGTSARFERVLLPVQSSCFCELLHLNPDRTSALSSYVVSHSRRTCLRQILLARVSHPTRWHNVPMEG